MTQYTKGQRVRLIQSGTDNEGSPIYGGFFGIGEFGTYFEVTSKNLHWIVVTDPEGQEEATYNFFENEFTTDLPNADSIWSDKVEAARLHYEGAQRLADQAQEFADEAKAELDRLEEQEAK